jgi:hypothetical protein
MNYDTGKGQPALYNDHSTNTVHIFLSATAGDGGTSTSEFRNFILVCKNLFTSRNLDAEQNRNIKTGNKYFEKVGMFKDLRKTNTNQNFVHEEIKRRLNSGNYC